jgi:hypothetical protein
MAGALTIRVLTCGLGLVGLLHSGCEHEPPTGGGVGGPERFEIRMEKKNIDSLGVSVRADVKLNKAPFQIAGFNFNLIHDAVFLTVQNVVAGDLHSDCGWEYFTYQTGSVIDSWGSGRSRIRVSAIAEISEHNTYVNQSCEDEMLLDGPVTLCSIDFLVSDDRTLECMYSPIRFYWEDCEDNTVTYRSRWDGGPLVTAAAYDIIDFDLIGSIRNDSVGFPAYQGFQRECYDLNAAQGSQPVRLVDFINGGIDIICADNTSQRGDVNLNGVPFEYEDYHLFGSYFTQGPDMFTLDRDAQIAATDVNDDGLSLTSSDWIYMERNVFRIARLVHVDDLQPGSAVCTISNGRLSVDRLVHAVLLVIEGDADWSPLRVDLGIVGRFDGDHTYLRIHDLRAYVLDELGNYEIFPLSFDGPFLQTDGEVVAIDMSTVDGARIDVVTVRD